MDQVQDAMQQVPPLFRHQQAAFEHIIKRNGSAALFHDPGLGKTRTALHAFFAVQNAHPDARLLVICPISLIEAAWRSDMNRFFGERQAIFRNAHKDGLPAIDLVPDVMALNYEFFTNRAKVQKLLPLLRAHKFMVVLDESSRIKNHSAITTKSLMEISSMFFARIVMSGTPAPNDETEYWAQIEFAAPGTFGKSFPKFRRTYFHLERNGIPVETQGMVISRQAMAELFQRGARYEISSKARQDMMAKIAPVANWAKKDECLDLPEQVEEVRQCFMRPRQAAAYRQMKRDLVADIAGKMVVAQVALTRVMKLREITSGFAMADDGTVVEVESPKLDLLSEVLDELGDRQAIIWCQFHWEIEKIKELLERRGAAEPGTTSKASFATLYSKTKDRDASINSFLSGESKYLIAHPRSAAHGLTFVNCAYQIFFSMDYSWEAFEQARARTHRAGQKSTCVYIYLVAAGTIDEDVLAVLRKKGDMQDVVYKAITGESGT